MEINSQEQLDAYLRATLTKALENTMKITLDKLYKIIDKDVYGWVSRSSDPWAPNRTFQFRDSWEKSRVKETKTMLKASISQRITTMGLRTINGVKIHTDRKDLTEIINSNDYDRYQFGDVSPDNPKTPFWDEFEKYCEVTFEETFRQECKKLDLDI